MNGPGDTTDAPSLQADLARITDLVPWLHGRTMTPGAPGAGAIPEGWHSCRRLCRDPDHTAEVVSAAGAALGIRSRAAAASVFAQGYSFRVASMPIAGWLLHGRFPTARPGALAVLVERGWATDVAWRRPVLSGDAGGAHELTDELVRQLIEAHLRPFLATIRRRTRVGARLLWGNAATAISVTCRAVHDAVPVERRAEVRAGAQHLLDRCPSEVRRGGAFRYDERGGRSPWTWERTTCCLWYQAPGAGFCADCPLPAAGV